MTRVYYKEALGAIVVYDITRPQTFEGVKRWKKDIDAKVALPDAWGGGQIPVILLANKVYLYFSDYTFIKLTLF
jgi:GTPase SAR1 family protein